MKLFFDFHYYNIYLYLFISLFMHLYLYFNEKNLKRCKMFIKIHFFSFNIFKNFFVYTPSNQHFKPFLVSKFNSETSFLYQLFKENSNFIVTESCKVIFNSIFYDFHYNLYLFVSLFMHLYTFISTF